MYALNVHKLQDTPKARFGALRRELQGVAKFLADFEAIKGWGMPLPPTPIGGMPLPPTPNGGMPLPPTPITVAKEPMPPRAA